MLWGVTLHSEQLSLLGVAHLRGSAVLPSALYVRPAQPSIRAGFCSPLSLLAALSSQQKLLPAARD